MRAGESKIASRSRNLSKESKKLKCENIVALKKASPQRRGTQPMPYKPKRSTKTCAFADLTKHVRSHRVGTCRPGRRTNIKDHTQQKHDNRNPTLIWSLLCQTPGVVASMLCANMIGHDLVYPSLLGHRQDVSAPRERRLSLLRRRHLWLRRHLALATPGQPDESGGLR